MVRNEGSPLRSQERESIQFPSQMIGVATTILLIYLLQVVVT